MKRFTINTFLFGSMAIAVGIAIYFIFWWRHEIIISSDRTEPIQDATLSAITGLPCATPARRPVAVMLASDPVTRPLSGLAAADVVVEMPVTPDGVTRLMAVFQCSDPKEIGSIRSARGDFLPLAGGFSALYAHWGGERDALDKLNKKVLDNIDALKYEGSTFYRKKGIPKPHDGFTTLELIFGRAQALKYGLITTFSGYPHREATTKRNVSSIIETITIPYQSPYTVRWEYDKTTNQYKRFRNNTAEMDKTAGEQITASNIIVLRTRAEPLRDQYLTVATTGQGEGTLYQDGIGLSISWKKDPASLASKLLFLDSKGKEVPFIPGKIWIEFILN